MTPAENNSNQPTGNPATDLLRDIPSDTRGLSSYLDFYRELLKEELESAAHMPVGSSWFNQRIVNLTKAREDLERMITESPSISEQEIAENFISEDPVQKYPSKYSIATLTITDLAKALFPFLDLSPRDKVLFRTMAKTKEAVLPYLFKKGSVGEEKTLLRKYIDSLFSVENYPDKGYVMYTAGTALGKADKHLHSSYTDEHTLNRMRDAYNTLQNFLRRIEETPEYSRRVKSIAVGGSFGRLLRKGYTPEKAEQVMDSLLGFDDASDLDLIIFTEAQPDSMLSDSRLIMQLRSLSKEVGSEYNIEVCEGGRLPSVDIEETGLWEYTNPRGMANYLQSSGLNPLSMAYTNVHYGKILTGEDWFDENIAPLFRIYEKNQFEKRKKELKSIVR